VSQRTEQKQAERRVAELEKALQEALAWWGWKEMVPAEEIAYNKLLAVSRGNAE
jgi:uncharacterized protein YcaQ